MQTGRDGTAIGVAAAALLAVALAAFLVLSRRTEEDAPPPAPAPAASPALSAPEPAGAADRPSGDHPTPEVPEINELHGEPAAAAASSVPEGEGEAPGTASGVLPVETAPGRAGAASSDRQAGPADAEERPGLTAEPPVPEAPAGGRGPPAPDEPWSAPRFTERAPDREAMVRVIRAYGLTDRAVLDAMLAVPRHEFVPEPYDRSAYADTPLPIGHGQTISQPYIVAEMTRVLRLTPDSRVLEIGTGSGYQAAVLTEFTPHVYTIEIVKPLAEAAKERLSRLGYGVVRSRHGDGYFGWPEAAPFDAVIVTCAAGQIPPPLVEQLRPGGRMVIPVGGRFATQWLMLVEKDLEGTVRSRSLMAVRFVPFVRAR